MPITGRAVRYQRYDYAALVRGVKLQPPEEALRAYIAAECGLVRWGVSVEEDLQAISRIGMPLEPGYPEEFDTDLKYLQLWAGSADAVAHVYYFRT